MLEQYQRKSHFLQRVNPTVKLLSMLLVVLLMIQVFDPLIPLLTLLFALGSLRVLGGIPLKVIFLVLIPFSLFAFSFVWISSVFPDQRGATIWFQVGSLPIAKEDVLTGLSLGLRSLVFASWSMIFVFTTEPTRFMLSLVQNCKLPPRFGYGVMAAYRFLPLFHQELGQIRSAHRIRGLGTKKGLRGKWQELRRYAIPLLASAIRKAERVAIAMESKGFHDDKQRTYYRHIGFSAFDIMYLFGLVVMLGCIFYVGG